MVSSAIAKNNSSIIACLEEHSVNAEVVLIRYGRKISSFGSVNTKYIIRLWGKGSTSNFKPIRLSKSYRDFRKLTAEIKQLSPGNHHKNSVLNTFSQDGSPDKKKSLKHLAGFCHSLSNTIDQEPANKYTNKITYTSVEKKSKDRQKIINNALNLILDSYPEVDDDDDDADMCILARMLNHFLLSDQVESETDDLDDDMCSHCSQIDMSPTLSPPPSPNRSTLLTKETTTEGKTAVMKEEKTAKTCVVAPVNTYIEPTKDTTTFSKKVQLLVESPTYFFIGFGLAVLSFVFLSKIELVFSADIQLMIILSAFICGKNIDRRINNPVVLMKGWTQSDVTELLKKSLSASRTSFNIDDNVSEEAPLKSSCDSNGIRFSKKSIRGFTLCSFPEGGKLGSVLNCWSEPVYSTFHVRGSTYLTDKIKIPSGPFIFPLRGADLFLTDDPPENIGSNPRICGGRLRECPTFIVNFRLPWGCLVTYHEIPSKFLPFLSHRQHPLPELPCMDGFSSHEICVAKYLLSSDEDRNQVLKIVPTVVKGPWIVTKVADGKPAIVGTKMPLSHIYCPKNMETNEECYLEVDLDIVASAAARGILSIAHKYTSVLTLDLGFVIEGRSPEVLPEQMLVGIRLHSIDPMTAPPLPEA